jgi:hypothetical protein
MDATGFFLSNFVIFLPGFRQGKSQLGLNKLKFKRAALVAAKI